MKRLDKKNCTETHRREEIYEMKANDKRREEGK
jgi:hypothetical protein